MTQHNYNVSTHHAHTRRVTIQSFPQRTILFLKVALHICHKHELHPFFMGSRRMLSMSQPVRNMFITYGDLECQRSEFF